MDYFLLYSLQFSFVKRSSMDYIVPKQLETLFAREENRVFYRAFRVRFGGRAPASEFVRWFRGGHGDEAYVPRLISTRDAELTRVLIKSGIDPHVDKDRALMIA